MKCPRCELITSNNREDCPRCGLDLRPIKETFNMQSIAAENSVQKNKSSFSDLVAIVDQKIKEKVNKSKLKSNSKTSHPVIDELLIPEIKLETKAEIKPEPAKQIQGSDDLQALIDKTSAIKDNNKVSSTNLEALTQLTQTIHKPKPIIIPAQSWQQCEIEIIKTSFANADFGYIEVLDLKNDKEIPVLFELAEREILDPKSVSNNRPSASIKKPQTNSTLEDAVRNFEIANDKSEALRKLNIVANSSVSLVIGDLLIPADIFRRFAAFLVDFNLNLVTSLTFAWFYLIPSNLKASILTFDTQIAFELIPYIFDLPLCFVIFWILSQWLMLATLGSTIGAKLFRIGITDQEGFLLTFKHSLLRSISWSVTFFTLGFGALMIFFRHRQTLHDRVSKTIVIHLGS